MTPADFASAGLYDPDAPNAADRLALLGWLADRGVTLDQMVRAHREGALPFLASGLALRPGKRVTAREVAERLGVPVAQVADFRLAFGFPPVGVDEPAFTEREAELFGAFTVGVRTYGEKTMRGLACVLGQSIGRIAEAMVVTNREGQLMPLLKSGASELAYAQAMLRAVETVDAPIAMIQALLPAHVELAGRRLRDGRASDVAETKHGCVGFVDLVGFTTLSQRVPAGDLAAVIGRFEEIAHDVAISRHGRVVKFIGDEVMFVTASPAAACDIALTLVGEFAGDAHVRPRGGVAEGELLDRAGDYYGAVVNLASRLAEIAVPREVLVSADVAGHVADGSLRVEPAGRRTLRGFDEPVMVASVTRS